LLPNHGFKRGKTSYTLFTKDKGKHFLLLQSYIDDIIFGAPNHGLCLQFSDLMSKEFEMSLVTTLNIFLKPQMKECEEAIFINQPKYIKEFLKKFKYDK